MKEFLGWLTLSANGALLVYHVGSGRYEIAAVHTFGALLTFGALFTYRDQ